MEINYFATKQELELIYNEIMSHNTIIIAGNPFDVPHLVTASTFELFWNLTERREGNAGLFFIIPKMFTNRPMEMSFNPYNKKYYFADSRHYLNYQMAVARKHFENTRIYYSPGVFARNSRKKELGICEQIWIDYVKIFTQLERVFKKGATKITVNRYQKYWISNGVSDEKKSGVLLSCIDF